jgi:putative PIN family toxin of toxin-antitoxin system
MRVVVDTGVLVSALLRRQGITGEILRALQNRYFTLIYTTPIIIEIIDVLGRDPFRTKYQIQPEDITALINLIRLRGELVIPGRSVKVCRDPKDDKFLEAALAGKAEAIVSGDADLLVLNPFKGIPILRPSEFLAKI